MAKEDSFLFTTGVSRTSFIRYDMEQMLLQYGYKLNTVSHEHPENSGSTSLNGIDNNQLLGSSASSLSGQNNSYLFGMRPMNEYYTGEFKQENIAKNELLSNDNSYSSNGQNMESKKRSRQSKKDPSLSIKKKTSPKQHNPIISPTSSSEEPCDGSSDSSSSKRGSLRINYTDQGIQIETGTGSFFLSNSKITSADEY